MLSISFFQTVMSIVEMISLSAAIFLLLFTWRVVAIQLLSQLFCTPWTAACRVSPLVSPGVYSDSCPLSQWCHPTISSSVSSFCSCLQSFPISGSFLMSWLFTSGGQTIGASASVLPINIQGWFPLGLTSLISLLPKGLSGVFFNTTVLWCSAFFMVKCSHAYMTTGKTIALTIWTIVSKVSTRQSEELLSTISLHLYWIFSGKLHQQIFAHLIPQCVILWELLSK